MYNYSEFFGCLTNHNTLQYPIFVILCRIEHDGKGVASGWHLEKVRSYFSYISAVMFGMINVLLQLLFNYELCLIGYNIDTSFQITITTNAPKQTYYFLYGGFIGKDVGKGHLYREIFAKKSLPKEVTTGIYCRHVYVYISSSDDMHTEI